MSWSRIGWFYYTSKKEIDFSISFYFVFDYYLLVFHIHNSIDMTYKEVFTKWIGKKYAESKELWHQCVWWAKLFCQEMWYPIKWFSWSALKWWQTWSPFNNEWKRIENSPTAIPKAGSIIFFDKSSVNPYGHVAVVDEWSTWMRLVIVEQNAWSGNGNGIGANAITRREISYNAVGARGKCLGWYEYIWVKQPEVIAPLPEDNTTLDRHEAIYREVIVWTNLKWVFDNHLGNEILNEWQIKTLIDIAFVKFMKTMQWKS